jgi:hypothetical protein
MQRNFVAGYLQGKYGSSNEKEAALVAFVSPDNADWRFSLVRMDYKFEQTPTGKIKVKEEFTPARRWSFLVGVNEKSHTAQSRLEKILADDENNPTLAELEDAFNIETVTKEFFLKYRDLFIRTKEALDRVVNNDAKIKADFETKGVNTVDFAKKLLGQIVFLYFLQKKGWFGVARDADWGAGSKQFLRELFEKKHSGYKNFFNDIMEPLFYEALRNDRSHDDNYYSRFNCKIPFLNGGLFDPIGNYDWVHTDIYLPDVLFSNRKTSDDEGSGILDIFDLYNFTVKEDEPLEKEVAVDPEMLGKVFENLLEVKDRKSKGTYYTPREIVHYMCQQSLISYLDTEINRGTVAYEKIGEQQFDMIGNDTKDGQLDLTIKHKSVVPSITKQHIETLIKYGEQVGENEAIVETKGKETVTYYYRLPESIRQNSKLIDEKLAGIKICDPAIGSGAFPVGMMNEIVRARNVLSTFMQDEDRKLYDFKRRCIEHSLYGVDIDPGAVEIAKLRLWLSLVVDEESIENIKPLPNLDYRIMQGNSLIEDFHGISLSLEKKKTDSDWLFSEKEELDKLIEDMYNKQNALFNATHPSDKKQKKEEVENAILDIFHCELQRQKEPYFMKLKDIEENAKRFPMEKDQKEHYESAKAKLDKEHNFNFKAVENELREMTHGNKVRSFFPWKLYFADVFRQKGGFDVVIANPPYVRADSSGIKQQREAIKKSNDYKTLWEKWDLYIAFIEKGYNLLSPKGVLEFIISDAYISSKYAIKSHDYFLNNAAINRINFCSNIKIFEAAVRNILIEYKKEINPNHIPLRIKHIDEWDNFIFLPSRKQSEMGENTFKLDSENKTIGDLSNTLTLMDS